MADKLVGQLVVSMAAKKDDKLGSLLADWRVVKLAEMLGLNLADQTVH